MSDKLSPKRASFSLAIVSGIVSIVCALLLTIFPAGAMDILGSIFHGVDLSQIAVNVSWPGALLGTIVAIVLGLIIGWLFAIIYNKFE